jgi:hypothetical protein
MNTNRIYQRWVKKKRGKERDEGGKRREREEKEEKDLQQVENKTRLSCRDQTSGSALTQPANIPALLISIFLGIFFLAFFSWHFFFLFSFFFRRVGTSHSSLLPPYLELHFVRLPPYRCNMFCCSSGQITSPFFVDAQVPYTDRPTRLNYTLQTTVRSI